MGASDFFNEGPLTLDEMMKIFSLLENPPEAAQIRKALRFYNTPKLPEYRWGGNADVMKVLQHFSFRQDPWELGEVLKLIDGNSAILEIGSGFGGTLRYLSSVLRVGATVVSVDLPVDNTPKYLNAQDSLKEACRQISTLGANVELFIGDSHSTQVVDAVANYAPFDFVFIDGDHTYDGIKKDWENYGPMGRVVGFHDIAGAVPEAREAWLDISNSGIYETREIINPGRPLDFGIGIIIREGAE